MPDGAVSARCATGSCGGTERVRRRARWAALLLFVTAVLGFAYACGVVLQPTAAPPVRPAPRTWSSSDLTIAYLGHASVLIDFGGTRILTDPTFFDRIGLAIGPVTIGPKRVVGAALAPDELPPLDAVVITHAHLDSLDLPSLRRVADAPLLVLPERTADIVAGLRFPRVAELGWGGRVDAGDVSIEAIEVDHWGERWPWERWRGYNGYLISRGDVRVLFASDTAYTPAIGRIGRERGVTVDVLGNGAYDPWIRNHAAPEQVWRMFQASGARYLIPVHWDTFRLGKEPLGEAMARLTAAAGAEADRIVVRRIGDTWTMPLPR
jgi:L-ascorbate metabolism protein UlaG (beta-lactamase superfamily)